MDPEQLAAAVAVADESLAAQTADYGLQAAIAQHRPDLWAALASNPTTYPGLLEWLSGIQEPAVRLALEARGIAPQTEAVPQAGDARPEGPVEPPAGEAEAAEPPDSPSGEAEPAESSADGAVPDEADSEVAADAPAEGASDGADEDVSEADASDEPADAPADEAEPEADASDEPADSPADEDESAGSSADGAAPEGASAGADEDVSEADVSDEPAESPADENEPEEAAPGSEAAAESPDSPSGEAEPAESSADEAAPEETDSEVAADAPADEDEPAESPADEVEPEEDAPGPEAAADASAGDGAPEEEPVEPLAEGASVGADEDVSEADASDEPADAPSDVAEPAESPSGEAEPEAAAESPDSPLGEAEPADEAEPEETDSEVAADAPAEGASVGADEDVSEADASDEPADAPSDVAEPAESPSGEAEPAESLAGEAALAGVSLGEVPAPPPETPASTPGTALSAGFASQPAVAPGSFFVPTQAQAAGSLGSAPSPSRTRKPVIIVVILALLLAGGAGGWFLMSVIYDTPITLSLPGQGHKAHRGGGKAAGDSTASDSTPGSVDPTGTGATNYVTPCGSAPTFTPASVKDGDGELKVEVKVTASCPSGDVLGGTANHIELKGPSRSDSTGSADAVVASGDFDFSDSPLVIPDSGTTLTLRFGEGHFFRTADDLDVKTITVACTPDRASGTSGATAGVPSASGSSNPSSVSASASTTSQDSASEESAAESSLKWQVDHDRPSVTKDLTGKWVAQLSSKKPGMTADGMTWDNRTTLQEFLKLRQKYPTAKLLYSEDWPVFDAGGKYWVTIAGTPYSTAAEANAWCDAQGFDAEHCFAKYIDTNGPSEGTTVNR